MRAAVAASIASWRLHRAVLLLSCVSVGFSAAAAGPTQFACEFWNPRLGQMPENFKYALDLDAKRCDGEPCAITDTNLTWSAQGGRYTVTIDRSTNNGTFMREGELIAVLENCQPMKLKP